MYFKSICCVNFDVLIFLLLLILCHFSCRKNTVLIRVFVLASFSHHFLYCRGFYSDLVPALSRTSNLKLPKMRIGQKPKKSVHVLLKPRSFLPGTDSTLAIKTVDSRIPNKTSGRGLVRIASYETKFYRFVI